jgi:hypothetical protein
MQTINNGNISTSSSSSSSSSTTRPMTMSFLHKDYNPEKTNDILCGRGNVYSTRPGNQYFQKIIQSNRCIYQDAVTRPEKIKVVDSILKEIHMNGVRFTRMAYSNNNKQQQQQQQQQQRWYELDNVAAHQKIGHAIRDTIRLHEKEKNNKSRSRSRSNININSNSSKSSIAIKKQKQKTMKKKRNDNSSTGRRRQQQQQQQQAVCSTSFTSCTSEYDDNNSITTTSMGEILRKSLESVDYLDDIFGNRSKNNFPSSSYEIEQQLKQQQQQIQKQRPRFSFSTNEIITTNKQSSSSSSSSSSQFLLMNEYPDTHFDFTASEFFGDDNDDEKEAEAEDDDTTYSYNLANEILSLSSQ